ncbi:hypothetical protein L598_008100000060 [Mesorhizobium sp. J18]|nr:hypothetical protein L598_008100000060 [Mesorhizobium sp. J18]
MGLISATWMVAGEYAYRFKKIGGDWRVTELTFRLEDETGDRGLVERAAAVATREGE